MAVRVGVGKTDYMPTPIGHVPDPTIDWRPCKHYQGVARGSAPDGMPYMFLTWSRNATKGCLDWVVNDPDGRF